MQRWNVDRYGGDIVAVIPPKYIIELLVIVCELVAVGLHLPDQLVLAFRNGSISAWIGSPASEVGFRSQTWTLEPSSPPEAARRFAGSAGSGRAWWSTKSLERRARCSGKINYRFRKSRRKRQKTSMQMRVTQRPVPIFHLFDLDFRKFFFFAQFLTA